MYFCGSDISVKNFVRVCPILMHWISELRPRPSSLSETLVAVHAPTTMSCDVTEALCKLTSCTASRRTCEEHSSCSDLDSAAHAIPQTAGDQSERAQIDTTCTITLGPTLFPMLPFLCPLWLQANRPSPCLIYSTCRLAMLGQATGGCKSQQRGAPHISN